MYRNLIPAYYIPAPHIPHTSSTSQASRGGFLVQAGTSGQAAFLQQPVTVSLTSNDYIAGNGSF